MIVRLWRTGIDPARLADYERFERTTALEIFRKQSGGGLWAGNAGSDRASDGAASRGGRDRPQTGREDPDSLGGVERDQADHALSAGEPALTSGLSVAGVVHAALGPSDK